MPLAMSSAARSWRERHRPAGLKGDGLNGSQRPVAVRRPRDITRHDRGIGSLTRWGDFYLFACCRREANAQRKPVHERGRDDSAPRCHRERIDEVLPGHRSSPSVWSHGHLEETIGSQPQVRQSDCWTCSAIAVRGICCRQSPVFPASFASRQHVARGRCAIRPAERWLSSPRPAEFANCVGDNLNRFPVHALAGA